MYILDFTLTESFISRAHHHSHCKEHEATREEIILWRRVKELESLIKGLRPPIVNEMLEAIPKNVGKVWVSVKSMELLQKHALDSIRLMVFPPSEGANQDIWGAIQFLVEYDGIEEPHTVWLACDPNLPDGEVSTEKASTSPTSVSETLRSGVDRPLAEMGSKSP